MDNELKHIIRTLFWPILFLAVIWFVFLLQHIIPFDPAILGIHPHHADGLLGIVTTIFVHHNLGHIVSNSIPFLILTWALFYYYSEFAFESLILMWLTTGLWVWFFARENYHIGASGLVYALAFFHVTSAILRRVFGLLAFAMLVIFLYGGMIWGFFPELFPLKNISWESHLMGAIAGVVFAVYYRKKGIQRKSIFDDEDDEDDEEEDDDSESPYHQHIKYYYTTKEEES